MKYTAFIVPDGQYEFLRVPFGLCNSLSVFQLFVNNVFKGLMRRKIINLHGRFNCVIQRRERRSTESRNRAENC